MPSNAGHDVGVRTKSRVSVYNALSRLTGSILAGVVRDVVTQVSGQALSGYLVVFSIEALMLLIAALMLTKIDVNKFQKSIEEPSFIEKVALAVD